MIPGNRHGVFVWIWMWMCRDVAHRVNWFQEPFHILQRKTQHTLSFHVDRWYLVEVENQQYYIDVVHPVRTMHNLYQRHLFTLHAANISFIELIFYYSMHCCLAWFRNCQFYLSVLIYLFIFIFISIFHAWSYFSFSIFVFLFYACARMWLWSNLIRMHCIDMYRVVLDMMANKNWYCIVSVKKLPSLFSEINLTLSLDVLRERDAYDKITERRNETKNIYSSYVNK